jgi:predicted ribosome-associated RNA-binding protein Tma20
MLALKRCSGKEKYSHITDEEMKILNKTLVNRVYTLLWLKTHQPEKYKVFVDLGAMFASGWDEPEFDFKF